MIKALSKKMTRTWDPHLLQVNPDFSSSSTRVKTLIFVVIDDVGSWSTLPNRSDISVHHFVWLEICISGLTYFAFAVNDRHGWLFILWADVVFRAQKPTSDVRLDGFVSGDINRSTNHNVQKSTHDNTQHREVVLHLSHYGILKTNPRNQQINETNKCNTRCSDQSNMTNCTTTSEVLVARETEICTMNNKSHIVSVHCGLTHWSCAGNWESIYI